MQRPEVKLARRFLYKRRLSPPIDVFTILGEYASIRLVRFPVAIDGFCLNLKAIGCQPDVFIELNAAKTRQRFTAAHELGHVLIPWHIGAIVDEIDGTGDGTIAEHDYWENETEANNFASELLMPKSWVESQVVKNDNPLIWLSNIVEGAQVSRQAASIRLIRNLPRDYVIACTSNGFVSWSSRSDGTVAATPEIGANLEDNNYYAFPNQSWKLIIGDNCYHCWHFLEAQFPPSTLPLDPWRSTLDMIVKQLIPTLEDQRRFKRSINGVVAGANSTTRSNRTQEAILTAVLQRLHANAARQEDYKKFVEHPLFLNFCWARVRDFDI